MKVKKNWFYILLALAFIFGPLFFGASFDFWLQDTLQILILIGIVGLIFYVGYQGFRTKKD